MRALLWTLVVLLLLAVGLDRGADWYAERTVATRLASSQDLDQVPDVDIAGFPFLTQVAARRFDRVTASTEGLQLRSGDRRLRLGRLDVVFGDVRTDRRFRSFSAARARATATVSYAELGRLTGLKMAYAGDGRVRASRTVSIAGRDVEPGVVVAPRLLEGSVRFADQVADGSLPASLRGPLRAALGTSVPLDGLPYDVRPESLEATEAGLRVRLSGRDLTYSG